MRIRTQLVALQAGFAVVFAGFVALALLSQPERVDDTVYRPILDTKDLVADILPPPAFIIETHMRAQTLALGVDAKEQAEQLEALARLEKEFNERRQVWLEVIEAGPIKEAIAAANRDADAYFALVHGRLVPAVQAGDAAAVRALVSGELKERFLAHRQGIDTVVAMADERSKAQVAAAAGSVRRTKQMLVAVAAVAVLVALLIGWRLSRSIASRLATAGAALERVAAGDYTHTVPADARDELGDLSRALNATIASGREVLAELKASAEEVGGASGKLSQSTVEVAQGAQKQADLVTRTVSDLEALTATVKDNTRQAEQAAQAAQATQAQARTGAEVMGRTRDSMKAIDEASRKVGAIATVIDDFAFQTNIVALNAAVEAARAGDAGRGFAVVANEVRSLAQRSAESAREVRTLVTDTIAKVKVGVGLVQESEAAFGRIGVATTQLTGAVDSMSSSFLGQVERLGTVSQELGTVSAVTQRNAAESEELSGMSELLKAQSSRLDELTRRFVVDGAEVDRQLLDG